ncbi:hypothetical protein [Mucisphaera calidilacus]|uniref:Flagellar protein FlgJ N-terminal domain-containing protein n=1 Tax=Mucisphaera calidilacus TaxID=2527982 RepID=A0A518BZG8_9BACT|nr:hypothetical protein [Mucisphaera calidilacus]QDU72364.1 hypothetical protein Pan265_22290 [Mucisphaera calidilacus]
MITVDPATQLTHASASSTSAEARANDASFVELLQRAGRVQNVAEMESAVREASEKLVSGMFIEPILQQVRNGPFKSEMFSGGMAGDMFGAQLDNLMAMRMAKASNWPIVDQLVHQLMGGRVPVQSAPASGAREIDVHG